MLYIVFVTETQKVCILCGEESEERLIILSTIGKNTVIQGSSSQSDGKEDEIQKSNPTHIHSTCRNLCTKHVIIEKAAAEAKERE